MVINALSHMAEHHVGYDDQTKAPEVTDEEFAEIVHRQDHDNGNEGLVIPHIHDGNKVITHPKDIA